jgi:hypothetical protein
VLSGDESGPDFIPTAKSQQTKGRVSADVRYWPSVDMPSLHRTCPLSGAKRHQTDLVLHRFLLAFPVRFASASISLEIKILSDRSSAFAMAMAIRLMLGLTRILMNSVRGSSLSTLVADLPFRAFFIISARQIE